VRFGFCVEIAKKLCGILYIMLLYCEYNRIRPGIRVRNLNTVIYSVMTIEKHFVHYVVVSCDRSIVSSKASSPNIAIW